MASLTNKQPTNNPIKQTDSQSVSQPASQPVIQPTIQSASQPASQPDRQTDRQSSHQPSSQSVSQPAENQKQPGPSTLLAFRCARRDVFQSRSKYLLFKGVEMYKEILTPPLMRITLPKGIPKHIDSDTVWRTTPWGLSLLYDSMYRFIIDPRTGTSFASFDKLLASHRVYTITSRISIGKRFSQAELGSLECVASLTHVGKSTIAINIDMLSPSRDEPLSSCTHQLVLLDITTKTKCHIPDWWKTKHVVSATTGKSLHIEPWRKSEEAGSSATFTVEADDTDPNKHANWTSFARYCLQSCFQNGDSRISDFNLNNEISEITAFYPGEVRKGETVNVLFWRDAILSTRLNFEISNNKSTSFQASVDFHSGSFVSAMLNSDIEKASVKSMF